MFTTFFIMGLGYLLAQSTLGRITGRGSAWFAFWLAVAGTLAVNWRQLSYLVWISCIVAALAAVLSALYPRDLGRRERAEAALADCTQRVVRFRSGAT